MLMIELATVDLAPTPPNYCARMGIKEHVVIRDLRDLISSGKICTSIRVIVSSILFRR